jgi:hypothetical protein
MAKQCLAIQIFSKYWYSDITTLGTEYGFETSIHSRCDGALSLFAGLVCHEILPCMSSECADRQDLVYGSGALPHQSQTLLGKADS